MQKRAWLDEATYAELVALCQTLPGPASTQTGIAIGLLRAGPLGALAAWLGFTLPSFVLMVAFAYLTTLPVELGWLFPVLKLVAFVVVALAVWRMARALAWDLPRGAIALGSAAVVFAFPVAIVQVLVIAVAGVVGWLVLPAPPTAPSAPLRVPVGPRVAAACLALYLALLVALPVASAATENFEVRLIDSIYRSGALVFGGGHVVLPLLHAEVVPNGWVSEDQFVAGYGAAQLMPGPLFTFAGFLGATIDGLTGAVLATLAIFLPGALLVFAALPSWGAVRSRSWAQRTLRGINAAVVGLLLAALVGIARAIASTLI